MILTLCATKARPKQCKQMLESFRDTVRMENKICLLLSADDDFNSYTECLKLADKYVVSPKETTVTQMLNSCVRKNDYFKYYHVTNDDVIYRTGGWDKKFVEKLEADGPGITFGNDLFQKENLPTFPFISSDIVQSLGWVQMPTLNRLCGDLVWEHIGKTLECLYYLPDVVIEHKHFFAGKADGLPVNYKEVYHDDMTAFANWMVKAYVDLDKICKYYHEKHGSKK